MPNDYSIFELNSQAILLLRKKSAHAGGDHGLYPIGCAGGGTALYCRAFFASAPCVDAYIKKMLFSSAQRYC